MHKIEKLNISLEKSFLELIRLLSDIMAETAPDLSKHSQQVAFLGKQVADKMGRGNSDK